MTAGNWIATAAVLVSTLSLLITVSRNGKTDTAQMAALMVKLEHLSEAVTEIKLNMRRYDEALEKHLERIVQVEQSAKSAHRRIDTIQSASGRSHKEGGQ